MAVDWQPSCELRQLQARAKLLADIRQYFLRNEVMEVETPLLCRATGTDPALDFFSTDYQTGSMLKRLYLQTSPEFAMKRLLASGSGSIFQICKAFRNGESGKLHNPEFTLLEWYRVDFDMRQLMQDVSSLLAEICQEHAQFQQVEMFSYQQVFKQYTGLDPLKFDEQLYRDYAQRHGFYDAIAVCEQNHKVWLDYIFSFVIQPQLGLDRICMVYAYPAIQSSLARINSVDSRVADRFEVFVNGVELANGFYELADAEEQAQRFEMEIIERQNNQQTTVQKDQLFLAALEHGLPECSGVALGLDRLLMAIQKRESIEEVLAFPLARA